MLAYVTSTPLDLQPPGFTPRFMVSIELLLYASARHHAAVFTDLVKAFTAQPEVAGNLLERVAVALLPQLGIDEFELANDIDGLHGGEKAHVDPAAAAALAAGEAAAAADAGSGIRGQGRPFETSMILGLAYLFIATGGKLNAFRRLVPHVFTTHLLLGTPPRAELNGQLAFDEQLEHMIRESDDLICAPFFWHGHVQALFIKETINRYTHPPPPPPRRMQHSTHARALTPTDTRVLLPACCFPRAAPRVLLPACCLHHPPAVASP